MQRNRDCDAHICGSYGSALMRGDGTAGRDRCHRFDGDDKRRRYIKIREVGICTCAKRDSDIFPKSGVKVGSSNAQSITWEL